MADVALLLDELEAYVNEQASLAYALREVRKRMEALQADAMQMSLMNMRVVNEPKPAKQPMRDEKLVKDVALISIEEFQAVPSYLRGRLTLPQVNGVLSSFRQAAILKHGRSHRNRFRDEETNETQSAIFVLEADLKELSGLPLDRRFYSILPVLRHCHRIKEIRGGGGRSLCPMLIGVYGVLWGPIEVYWGLWGFYWVPLKSMGVYWGLWVSIGFH
ncbi:SKA complex subunit 1 isoform X3 [Excalfactoria chinensis]